MANYLTAVVPRHLEGSFRDFVGPYLPEPVDGAGGSPEHLVLDLPGTTARLHHVARGAAADVVPDPSGAPAAVFHGYAQSPDPGVTVFGAAGVRLLLREGRPVPTGTVPGQEWDGPHLSVSWGDGLLSAHTDFFRSLPMMVTSGAGMMAVSDSWQVLVRLRTALGLPVTVSTEVAGALTVQRIVTEHPVDCQTLCSQVRLLTIGSTVRARWGPDGVEDLAVTQVPFAELFAEPEGTWQDTVRQGAATMASVLRSHAEIGLPLHLSLSGGADSRAVLAAMRRADPAQDLSALNTTNKGPANVRDAQVVQDLVRTSGLRFGARPDLPARVERYPSAFPAWMIGSLALHDRLNTPRSRVLPGSHYTLTGHGAGVYKATYGWRPFTDVARGLEEYDPAGGPLAGRRARGFLETVGVDPRSPESSEWHFIGLRNALHGGRSTLTNLLSYPPLMQRRLTALAHVEPGSPRATPEPLRRGRRGNATRPNTSLTSIMLSLLDPDLASRPFDDSHKDIDPRTLKTILEVSGGPLADAELVPVRSYGSPQDVESGVAETFLNMAASWGQDVRHRQSDIAPLVAEGGRIADGLGLGQWYGPMAERAGSLLQERTAMSQQRGGYGKLLSFLPLASAGLDGPVPDRGSIERNARAFAASRVSTEREQTARATTAAVKTLQVRQPGRRPGSSTPVPGRAWTRIRPVLVRVTPPPAQRPARAAERWIRGLNRQ